ncbi:MAG: hypothetical protein QM499_01245 [Flavobacteriaceae bacterium]
MSNTEKKLKERVDIARKELNNLGVKSARLYFTIKYTEYRPKDNKDVQSINRLDNLWYGKTTNDSFTEKLESFVVFNKVHFT